MTMWLLLLGAFEFVCPGGPAAAMLAGGAVMDWQHGLAINPALVSTTRRAGAAALHARPFGLEGLDWNRAGFNWQGRAVGISASAASLSLSSYRESDVQLSLSGSLAGRFRAGLSIHALMLSMARAGSDFVPAFDVGGCYSTGTLTFGASVLRLNGPRWNDGIDLPARVVLSSAWRPVETLLLAADASREGTAEGIGLGIEFRIIPQAGLRFGVGTGPLRYAGGVGVEVGPVLFDYAWQFHAQLKGTHVVGLALAWR